MESMGTENGNGSAYRDPREARKSSTVDQTLLIASS